MRNNRPIRTRPWKRPPWKRRRSGFWFVSPVSPGFDSGTQSSWAESTAQLLLDADPASGNHQLQIPLLWNAMEAFTPNEIANMSESNPVRLKAHPFAERFRVERIVGDVLVAGFPLSLSPGEHAPPGPMLVNMSFQHTSALGDAVVVYDPASNDAAVGRRRLHERRIFISPSGDFCDGCSQGDPTANQPQLRRSFASVYQIPSSKVVHFDIKTRIQVREETTLTLIMSASGSTASGGDFPSVAVIPKLKLWVAKG